MSAKAEARDLAYRVWRECGQNLSETQRRLCRDHDLPVTRQTLAEWCQRYDWKDRAARVECAETQKANCISDDALITALLAQKQRYEDYFESLTKGQIDNQALYAYSNILKTLVDFANKKRSEVVEVDRPAVFLESLKFVAETLREVDPEGLKVFAGSFDVIVSRYKEAMKNSGKTS